MPTETPDPWSEVERAFVSVGTVADAADRYRLVREGEGSRLLGAALSLGRRTRALHRRGAAKASELVTIARDLDSIAARYCVLLDRIFASPEYHAVLAAYAGNDHAVLARLIPAVLADIGRADNPRDAYYPVSMNAAGNRVVTPDVLADRLIALRTTGITAADPGAPGTDGHLRAVTLQADWRHLETPAALRFNARTVVPPLFRLASSAELLIYTEMLTADDLTAPPTIVIARAAGPDRWPETGVDYKEFRVALTSVLDERHHSYILLDG